MTLSWTQELKITQQEAKKTYFNIYAPYNTLRKLHINFAACKQKNVSYV